MSEAKSGKTYLGVMCRGCQNPILFAEDPSDGSVAVAGPGRLELTCQYCSLTETYPAEAAQHFRAGSAH